MFSSPGKINAMVPVKKMHFILKEKALFLNFIKLLSIQVEKEKKNHREVDV